MSPGGLPGKRPAVVATAKLTHSGDTHSQSLSSLADPSTPSPKSAAGLRFHLVSVALILVVAFIWVFSAEFIQIIFGKSAHPVGHTPYDKPYLLTYVSVSSFTSLLLLFFVRPSWRAAAAGLQPLPTTVPGDEAACTITPDLATAAPEPVAPPREALRLALRRALPYFFANLTFNLGLRLTSVASSSTISTLNSLFVLGINTVVGSSFSLTKLAASLFSIIGVALIFAFDKSSAKHSVGETSAPSPMLGDAFSVISAMLYALTSKLFETDDDGAPKSLHRHDSSAGDSDASESEDETEPKRKVDNAMALGFMGAVVAVLLGPIVLPILHITGLERFEFPPPRVAVLLLGNAFIGTVLSDFLWATSIARTDAHFVSLCLTLTVPISFFADVALRGKETVSWSNMSGATLVLVGFVLANLEMRREDGAKSTAIGPSRPRNGTGRHEHDEFAVDESDLAQVENRVL